MEIGMLKKAGFVLVVAVLALLIVPVLITLSSPPEQRSLLGASLTTLKYEEVRFSNDEQGIELAGMLFVPEGEGPFPAVVIIHGSGTSIRDNPWYLTLTSYLQQQGVGVLLPDKRGSAASGGDWRSSSLEDLATDTLAALDYLRGQDWIDISQIGIIGMSQGGQIAPVVAATSTELDFIVNVVGSSLPIYDVLLYEETNNLREIGFLPGVADLIAYPSTFVLREFSQQEFWDAVGNFDPLPYWREIELPILVLYGSEDTNVPSEVSKARLEALDKENIEVRIYAGSGHALEDPPGMGSSFFREDALSDIERFISQQAE
jgi:dienelactone hydrolase